MNFLQWMWLLTASHCLADTALQTRAMAAGKNRNRSIDMANVPPGQKPLNLWWMWLTHHAFIHGLMIYLLTQNIYLGMIETAGHWLIDLGKGENLYSPYGDQALHLTMKLCYAIYLVGGLQ